MLYGVSAKSGILNLNSCFSPKQHYDSKLSSRIHRSHHFHPPWPLSEELQPAIGLGYLHQYDSSGIPNSTFPKPSCLYFTQTFPSFPNFRKCHLVPQSSSIQRFLELSLTRLSSPPAPTHPPHHQILCTVPLKYISVPPPGPHAPVTDMTQATIPFPQNSSLQSLDPWPEGKE